MMTGIDIQAQPGGHAMTGARLCISIAMFMLCNAAAAVVVPLLAMVST